MFGFSYGNISVLIIVLFILICFGSDIFLIWGTRMAFSIEGGGIVQVLQWRNPV